MHWKDRAYLRMNGKLDLNLSNDVKIKVLKLSLDIIAKNKLECSQDGKPIYMCIAVRYACDKLGIKYDDSVSVGNIIPEIVRYMPSNLSSIHKSWFNTDNRGIKKRVMILTKLIEDLSSKPSKP